MEKIEDNKDICICKGLSLGLNLDMENLLHEGECGCKEIKESQRRHIINKIY